MLAGRKAEKLKSRKVGRLNGRVEGWKVERLKG